MIVDLCPACAGFWLDRGEIQSLEVFAERMRCDERREEQQDFFAELRRLLTS